LGFPAENVKKGFAFFDKGAAACRSAGIVRLRRTIPTFAGRDVFLTTYMPPEKTDQMVSRLRARTLRGALTN